MPALTISSPVTEGNIPLTLEPGGQGARGLGQELEKLLVSPFILAVVGAGEAGALGQVTKCMEVGCKESEVKAHL